MNIKNIKKKEIKQNLIIYSAGILIAVMGMIYGQSIQSKYSFLRVWDYQNILFLFVGIPFLFWQNNVALPNFWGENNSLRKKILFPAFIGALFGILDILIVKVMLHPQPYTELPPFLQPFPYSLFLYFSGAFEIEIFYRLIPLTLILLAGKWLAKGKYFTVFLWAGIVLTSIREPLEQLPDGQTWLVIYSLFTGFFMNFLQAWYYTKSGFLASLFIRLGHYAFWHILLGMYVQYVELG